MSICHITFSAPSFLGSYLYVAFLAWRPARRQVIYRRVFTCNTENRRPLLRLNDLQILILLWFIFIFVVRYTTLIPWYNIWWDGQKKKKIGVRVYRIHYILYSCPVNKANINKQNKMIDKINAMLGSSYNILMLVSRPLS